jgi:hypothetical protein
MAADVPLRRNRDYTLICAGQGLSCSLMTAASNPTWRALYLLVVVLAKRHGASSTLVGVMFAVIAAGGLLGGLVASSRFAAAVSARTAVRVDA